MKIVGVGAGPGMLTQEAIETIESARRVYGSPRALALAREHIKVKPIVLEDYDLKLEEDACVLATGDPMLSGLGKKAPHGSTMIPGISSLQLACSREMIDIADIIVLSTHGKDANHAEKAIESALCFERAIFIVADPRFDLSDICTYLTKKGYDGDIALLEDLGYETERAAYGTISCPPTRQSSLFCALLRNVHKRQEK